MKVCIPTATGGHLTEVLYLIEAFEGHDIFFIAEDSARTEALTYRTYRFQTIGTSVWRLLKALPRVAAILWRERPDIVFSTGGEIAVPIFYIGKLLGAKTVFVESVCRLEEPTFSGRLTYLVSDLFLVQQPQLLSKYGAKAHYEGGII